MPANRINPLKLRSADAFLGCWELTRQIEDAKAKSTARFEGRASVRARDSGWLYHEEGKLHLAHGAPLHAERRYLWLPVGQGIDISFEDGRFFHRMELSSAQESSEAAHWCDPDQYDVRYDFSGWPVWQSTWKVTGPRKNYVMQSRYRPL